jgi:DNA-binding SARP family transcriptional activator
MAVVETPMQGQLPPRFADATAPGSGAVVIPFRRVQVRLLGSVAVLDADGVGLDLPSARLVRAVLATLALRAGEVVQTWELVDSVWGTDSPVTVRKTLQTYIWALRRVLGFGVIERVGDGYRLQVQPADVDVSRFERYIGDGSDSLHRGDLGAAVTSLSTALGLWRGEPLEELVDSPTGMGARARLSELRGVAEERLYEARLRLGEHDEVVADLQAAVRVEPFRERRWQQLMVALYRCGRQGEAMAAFGQLQLFLERHHLRAGDDLQALKAAIAARDPNLAWKPPMAEADGGWAGRRGPASAPIGLGSARQLVVVAGQLGVT